MTHRYCGNDQCENRFTYILDNERFCQDCGYETTPAPKCLGFRDEKPCTAQLNLKVIAYWMKRDKRPSFCSNCGSKLDEEFLGQCMSIHMGKLVKQVAEKMSSS